MKEKGMDLLKILPKETYPQLRDWFEDEFYVWQHVLM
jgi:hypothetical protein